jgi:Holliday junction DNA helicase RuvA
MINGLRGTLLSRGGDHAILDVHGVFYKVFMPGSVLADLGGEGETVTVLTHLYVREDQMALYGTRTSKQMEMFETLLNVSGVGPRLALAILGTLPVDTLENAISAGDVMLLTRVPGVGKKLAQRLVLELKGKLDLAAIGMAPGGAALTGPAGEVVAALTSLGYTTAEITAVLPKLPKDPTLGTEDLIMAALREMAS